MLVKEFTGRSERDAVAKALESLNLTEDQVRIEVIDKGKRNIFGIGEEHPTIIRVYYEEVSSNVADFKNVISTILKHMNIQGEIIAKEENEKRIYINITTEEPGVLIGRKGATLEALQLVVSLIAIRHFLDEPDRHVVIDVDGYRIRREETLKQLARHSAQQAKRSRRTISLDPMSPYERRIIHLELQEDPEIETRSEGESPNRSVRVFLKQRGGQAQSNGRYQGNRRYRDNAGSSNYRPNYGGN